MEVIRGWTHAAFPIDDASRVGEARRHAAQLSTHLQWGELEAGKLALVVTELGSNLMRHARGGRMLIAARPTFEDVEIICVDDGPGIPNLGKSFEDGFSTGSGSPGTGLGAVRRLASSFDIFSTVPHGTVAVARVAGTPKQKSGHGPGTRPAYSFGAICLPIAGESACGDSWGVALGANAATVVLADGLGHGPLAAEASLAAVEVFAEDAGGDLRELVQRTHVRLQTTRGAALCMLRIDGIAQKVHCAGAGNVAVRIASGVFDKSMATQHGTVGVQIRRPDESSLALPQHAVAIVHSDGLTTRWPVDAILPVLERDPTIAAAILWKNHARGRDDATVVVIRQESTT